MVKILAIQNNCSQDGAVDTAPIQHKVFPRENSSPVCKLLRQNINPFLQCARALKLPAKSPEETGGRQSPGAFPHM